jgi:hypothetical protein
VHSDLAMPVLLYGVPEIQFQRLRSIMLGILFSVWGCIDDLAGSVGNSCSLPFAEDLIDRDQPPMRESRWLARTLS